jgi:hypothetical protein
VHDERIAIGFPAGTERPRDRGGHPAPIPPADIICIRITVGNTSATPASASVPRKPTK